MERGAPPHPLGKQLIRSVYSNSTSLPKTQLPLPKKKNGKTFFNCPPPQKKKERKINEMKYQKRCTHFQ